MNRQTFTGVNRITEEDEGAKQHLAKIPSIENEDAFRGNEVIGSWMGQRRVSRPIQKS